jgi:hypothetical protein
MADQHRRTEAEPMNGAKPAIILCLAIAALSHSACAADTFDRRFYSYGPSDGYRQTDYYGQTRPYEYHDPYAYQRPYASPWTGQRPYWNPPRSRVFSPDPGVACDRRREVCYKWHDGSREWRPDRSDTKDNFGKKAARRLER